MAMNYGFMGQNPYYPYQQMNQYPNHFVNAMQQNYSLPQQPQMQSQQQTQQQTITTQPPIMQPQASVGSKIIPVANKEEATGTAVDLVNGTPSFFYNKSNGEIYLKQFDIPTGKGIFKTYIETQPENETSKEQPVIINYDKQINYLIQGMDNLHRMVAQLQEQRQYPVNIKEVNTDVIDIEPEPLEDYSKSKSNKKRGQ